MVSRLELESARNNACALAAQEAELHRIAQDLHNEIDQSLTVVLLGLSRAAGSASPDLTEELQVPQETARVLKSVADQDLLNADHAAM